MVVVLLSGCELLTDPEQREVVTVIKLESEECTFYLQKEMAIDNSSMSGNVTRQPDAVILDAEMKEKDTQPQ